MKSHELKTVQTKTAIRPGRGIAAGRGKTAGRGTKGQNSRAGGKRRPGFEGGQNPLFQRLPKKRGFRTFRTAPDTITTAQLDSLDAKVDNQSLFESGLIEDLYVDVKVVVKGEVSKKHTVDLYAASKAAVAMIEKAGGSFNQIERQKRPKSQKTD